MIADKKKQTVDSKKVTLFLVIYVLLITLIHIFKPGNVAQYEIITNIITVLSSLIPIVLGIIAFKHFGFSSLNGKAILSIIAAIASWLAGDILWIIYDNAVISAADVLYLIGYPLLALGIYFGVKEINPGFFNRKTLFISSLVGLIVSVLYLFIFPIEWQSSASLLENLVTSGYVLADLLILLFNFMLVSQVVVQDYGTTWIITGMGIVLWWAGDVYYALYYESYVSGSLIDLSWYFGNLMIGLGLYNLTKLDINKKEL